MLGRELSYVSIVDEVCGHPGRVVDLFGRGFAPFISELVGYGFVPGFMHCGCWRVGFVFFDLILNVIRHFLQHGGMLPSFV